MPPAAVLARAVAQLKQQVPAQTLGDEKRLLSRALAMEVETSDFYRRLTSEMQGEAQQLFARFQEIEDGHIATVQAELDYLSHTGFWFDFQEFDLDD